MSLVLICVWTAFGNAQDLARNLVVAYDQETAKLLPPQNVLGVLVNDGNESYETINARALAMRHATYFVYQSGQASPLAGMYRERLQTQGVVPIELPRQVKRQKDVLWLSVEATLPRTIPQVKLANLIRVPQE